MLPDGDRRPDLTEPAPDAVGLIVRVCTPPTFAYRPCKVNIDDMWSVDIELIAEWLASLDDGSREQVVAAIELLEDRGPQLG